LFAESVLQEILGEEHATNSRSTSPVAALRTPDESASRDSTAPAEEQAKPRPKIRHLRNALPSPATSNDQFGGNDVAMGTASSDEDVIMVDATDRFLSPARIGRSRRARPRVSYVDPLADDISVVSYGDDDEGEDTDAYTPPPIYEESEVEFDSASSDHELSDDSDAGSVEGEIADDVSLIEDEQPKLASESRKQTKSGKSSKSKPGVDLNLPPLSNIHEIFADMALKAEELGLCDVLNKLGDRQLRVGTMCSGTEAPLISLQLLSEDQSNNLQPLLYKTNVIYRAFEERTLCDQRQTLLFRRDRSCEASVYRAKLSARTAFQRRSRVHPQGLYCDNRVWS
jgi:hypothetical protein